MDEEATVAAVDEETEQTYLEASSDGAVMVELDGMGRLLRCQLEPEVNASWTADVLADRIVRLYQLALMRARCAERERINEQGAGIAPTTTYPTPSEVDEYRRNLDF